jgi:uncharacterized SAM-binding protein YcdF (DUF218 family)
MRRIRRWLIALLGIAATLGMIYALRFSLLRGVGNWLVVSDTLVPSDAIVVLSSNPHERLPEAAKLWREGIAPRIVTTGANQSPSLTVLGITKPDAQLGREVLASMGIDSSALMALPLGTSTREEAEAVLGYAQREGLQRLVLLSSALHTRRSAQVFRRAFEGSGIHLLVHPAPPVEYSLDRWWESEEGLLFVNNEYVKLIYYALYP